MVYGKNDFSLKLNVKVKSVFFFCCFDFLKIRFIIVMDDFFGFDNV